MSLYIDEDYMVSFMGAENLSSSLCYGGTSAATTGSVLARFLSASCSHVDSFLEPTYEVPIGAPPENLKMIAAAVCQSYLMRRSHQPLDQFLDGQLKEGTGYLMLVREGKLSLPGISEDMAGAVAGGSCFIANVGGVFQNLTGSY